MLVTALSTSSARLRVSRWASSLGGSGSGRTTAYPAPSQGLYGPARPLASDVAQVASVAHCRYRQRAAQAASPAMRQPPCVEESAATAATDDCLGHARLRPAHGRSGSLEPLVADSASARLRALRTAAIAQSTVGAA